MNANTDCRAFVIACIDRRGACAEYVEVLRFALAAGYAYAAEVIESMLDDGTLVTPVSLTTLVVR